jgi:chemotaxis-related protein WspD
MYNRLPIAPGSTRSIIHDCWNTIGVRGDASCPALAQHIHCRNCPVYSAAAAELLNGDVPAHYLADWTSHYAQEKQVEECDTHSVVIFRIAAEWFALPTSLFTEVTTMRVIHSLPHRRRSMVLGVTNVRGELLVCVSLSHMLSLDKTTESTQGQQQPIHRRLLVLHDESSRTVFPVDEVHGIHRFHPRELQKVPATVAKATATYTTAILSWHNKSVGLLDHQLLLYTLHRSLG